MPQNTTPDLIPRKALFGNPQRERVTVSRDGTRIAFLAPVDGVMNVWVAPLTSLDEARPVTSDTLRGIHFYAWSYNDDVILYIQDSAGDENWHVYAVDIRSLVTRDLTPYDSVHAMLAGLSPRFRDEVLSRPQQPGAAVSRSAPHRHGHGRLVARAGERHRRHRIRCRRRFHCQAGHGDTAGRLPAGSWLVRQTAAGRP